MNKPTISVKLDLRFCCTIHAIGWKLIWCRILIYMCSCFHQHFMKLLNALFILLHWKFCGNRKQEGINIGKILQSCFQPIMLLLLWTYQKILNYILFRKHTINAIVEGFMVYTEQIIITNLQSKTNWGCLLSLKKGCLWFARKFKKLKWIPYSRE